MGAFLLLVSLACKPGEHLLDLSDKLPRGLRSLDIVVSVEPFYARIYIYEAGVPASFQQCCGDKRTSVLKMPVISGRFCLRQSQPHMRWNVRVLLKPDLEL